MGGIHLLLLAVGLLFPPTVLGILGAAYLSWRLAHPVGRIWSPGWMLAGRIGLVVVGGWLVWVMILGPLSLVLTRGVGG